ncbi:MAG: type II toxin-antitoxin system VapC family toxin [Bacillota bacterium]
MKICIDASLALMWLLPAELNDRANALRKKWDAEAVQLISAPLFYAEVTSVLREQVYFQKLLPEEGEEAFSLCLEMGVKILRDSSRIQKKAWELAKKHNRTRTYDMQYLAVAEIEDCDFWTADKRLCNALAKKVPRLKYVGEFQGGGPGSQ